MKTHLIPTPLPDLVVVTIDYFQDDVDLYTSAHLVAKVIEKVIPLE